MVHMLHRSLISPSIYGINIKLSWQCYKKEIDKNTIFPYFWDTRYKCTVVYINFYGMLRVALGIIQYYFYDSLFTAFILEFISFSNYSIYIRWHLPTEQHLILLACSEVVMYSFWLFPRGKQQRLRSWSFIKFFEIFRSLLKSHTKSEVTWSLVKSQKVLRSLMNSHEVFWSLVKPFVAPSIVLKKSKTFIIRLVNQKVAEKINQLCGRIVFNALILWEIQTSIV